MNLKMEPFISDNGKKVLDTEEVNSYGTTEAFTKGTGKIIPPMVKED